MFFHTQMPPRANNQDFEMGQPPRAHANPYGQAFQAGRPGQAGAAPDARPADGFQNANPAQDAAGGANARAGAYAGAFNREVPRQPDVENPQPAHQGPVSRRLFTTNMSRFTLLGGAAGLLAGAVITGAYGGAKQAGLSKAFNCDGLTPIGCLTDSFLYSKAVVAALMVAFPLLGAAVGAGIKKVRFNKGIDDAETSQPLPQSRAPFITKALGKSMLIGAGLGLVAGGLSALSVYGSFKQHMSNMYAACNYQVNNFSGEPASCSGDDNSVTETNQHLDVADLALVLTLLPVAGAVLGMAERALKRDYRKPEAQR